MTHLGKKPFSVEQGDDTAAEWWDLAEETEESGLVPFLFSLSRKLIKKQKRFAVRSAEGCLELHF